MQGPAEPHLSAPSRPVGPEEEARVARAHRRVAALKGFYVHLAIYVGVLAALFVVNAITGGSWWVLWVLFGWGIGVGAHALAVFGRTPKVVADWEKRKVEQLVREQ